MPCGWEGNGTFGVALAMRHRFQWFIHLRAHGLRKGDEHPAYTSHGVWHIFPLPLNTATTPTFFQDHTSIKQLRLQRRMQAAGSKM